MDSFHLLHCFSIYKFLFLSYLPIQVEKTLKNSSRWNPPATHPSPAIAKPARRPSPPLWLRNQTGSPLFRLPIRWTQTLLPLCPPRMQTKWCSSEMFLSAHAKPSWGFVWFTYGRLEIYTRKPCLDKRCSLSTKRFVNVFGFPLYFCLESSFWFNISRLDIFSESYFQ